MDTLAQATAICQGAEKSLRDLMQSAIAAGEYRDLPFLARLAEQLAQMAGKLAHSPESPPPAAQASSSVAPAPARRRGGGRRRGRGRQRPATSSPPPRSIKADYPKFRRDGENLVKTGWSKSSRAEYEHRAPKRVAGALLKAISAVSEKVPVFTVEHLLPLADPRDNTEVAGYQVYLALAWLRKEGIVRQHGREGYSLLVKSELDRLLEERWTRLSN